jgi:hypothetical protein
MQNAAAVAKASAVARPLGDELAARQCQMGGSGEWTRN